MGANGLKQGLPNGLHSGLKNGLSSGLCQGLSLGNTNGTVKTTVPTMNPLLLKGSKKPIIYGLADFFTQPSGINTTLTDIASTGITLTCNTGGSIRPAPNKGGAFGTKYSMDFNNSQSYFTNSSSISLSNAFSFISVFKLNGNTSAGLFHLDSEISPGGCNVSINSTNNQLKSTFYGGSGGSITNSQFVTNQSPNVMNDWIIASGTYRLSQPGGAGSEQDLFINGMRQHDLSSSNFTVVTTTISGVNIVVGNLSTSAPLGAIGMQFGAFIMFNYYLNSQERMLIENYFRMYYGYKF